MIIEKLLLSIFNYEGINTVTAGVIPTPGLSFVLQSNKYVMGIMITASHNPHYDNGIKLYSNGGFKLLEQEEKIIEQNKQALIMIPEIFLTGQFKKRFELFFGYFKASQIIIKGKAPIMASDRQNLQDAFLNQVRKTKIPVTVFLINGVKLQGAITWFDNFCIFISFAKI